MPTTFRDGNVSVTLSGDIERLALAAVDRVLPGVRAKMEAGVQAVFADAVARWPVKTGRSSRGLRIVTEIRDDKVVVKIINAVPYAVYVRPADWFGVETAWNRLCRKPMSKAAKDIAKEVGPVVIDAMRRAHGG